MYIIANEEFKALLGNSAIDYLHGKNIRHIEQLVSAINDELGYRALMELKLISNFDALIKISEDWVIEAEQSAQAELIAGLKVNEIKKSSDKSIFEFVNGVEISLPKDDLSGRFGTVPSNYSEVLQGSAMISSISDNSDTLVTPPSYYLYDDLENAPKVLDQGNRGTCVAFAACAAAENLIKRSPSCTFLPKFSQQWAYYKAKLEDASKEHLPGTTLKLMAEALKTHGFVLNENLPYIERPDEAQALFFKRPQHSLKDLENEGKRLKLTSYSQIRATDVNGLKKAVFNGSCVILVVPVYQRDWLSPYVLARGEVELPFQDPETNRILDERQGFHAITLYGFEDTPEDTSGNEISRPGGGYFIFRNSWGDRWGKHRSETPSGYGMLPYAYVELLAADAMIFTEITRINSDRSKSKTIYRHP